VKVRHLSLQRQGSRVDEKGMRRQRSPGEGGEAYHSGLPDSTPRGSISEANDFDMLVLMSRKHNIDLDTVWDLRKEFRALDRDKDDKLDVNEFKQGLIRRCNLPANADIPEHLLSAGFGQVDADGDGKVSFDEYVLWSALNRFTEEFCVADPKQRQLREIARRNNLDLLEVERVQVVFDTFDTDKSGAIEQSEFRCVLAHLTGEATVTADRFQRYWKEVDTDMSGEVSFEEFAIWYLKIQTKSPI
jgi:Ca2+-binding EF-hand superfamily protein